jgi:polysaccharide export outer membrane protein
MTSKNINKYTGLLSKALLIALLGAMILSSCVPMKKIRYLQEEKGTKTEKTDFKNKDTIVYRIHPGDNLYIKIASLDEKSNYFENSTNYNNYYTESAIYLNSYTVNDSGMVEFPLIGVVNVDNLTITEIRDKIQLKVNEYVKNTVVIVKLANFRISMFGEFHLPGKYIVYQDKINIFEAIAMAGDMTDFAKKNKVLLIRQTETGSKAYRINLNDVSIMESDLYYLMPNDLIYVEPVKGKQFAFSEFPYVLILTTVTTTLLLLNYFSTN